MNPSNDTIKTLLILQTLTLVLIGFMILDIRNGLVSMEDMQWQSYKQDFQYYHNVPDITMTPEDYRDHLQDLEEELRLETEDFQGQAKIN